MVVSASLLKVLQVETRAVLPVISFIIDTSFSLFFGFFCFFTCFG